MTKPDQKQKNMNTNGLRKSVVKGIDVFDNSFKGRQYIITHINEEYTSVCPKTGLPDFGKVIISYIPKDLCIELKTLKYYFLGYRNKGVFYEALVNQILADMIQACDPTYMEVIGEFGTRGGIRTQVRAVHDTRNRGKIIQPMQVQ